MTLRSPADDEVHVWIVPCAEPAPAARRDAGRQALADIVRGYAPDAQVVFRPSHRARILGSPLRVSRADGGGFALVAVATARDVGIDVEPVRSAPEPAVCEHLLTAAEARALARLDEAERDMAFARAWVRKEAALKAVGVGLAIEPCLVEVGVAETGSRLVAIPDHGDVVVRDLEVDGHVAAVAAVGAAPLAVRRVKDVPSSRAGRVTLCGMSREPDVNVVGGDLLPCSAEPMTGFYREGCCSTGDEDVGSHTVCTVMTEEFLAFSRDAGNDLSTPRPEWGFPGLQPGDRWCVCASRWLEAYEAGYAAPVVLGATHARALDVVPIEALTRHAVPAEAP